MDIEVKRNGQTQGWCADFYKNGHKYYADVSWVQFCGPECMIFAYDEDGHIDWDGVYCNKQVSVSKETLLNCIKDFMRRKQ